MNWVIGRNVNVATSS